MSPNRNRIAQQIVRFGALLFLLFRFAAPLDAQTSAKGAISGTVQEPNGGALLQGAEVILAGTAYRTLTERDGAFSFATVPAGAYRLQIFYTGYATKELAVEVKGGETSHVSAILGSDIQVLEAYKVSDEREGNAASIMRQKDAPNVMNAVSMDAYGDVADGNIGNFMQNIPGVSVNREAGDIIGIVVRGMPPELNNLSLDGTRTASAIAGFTPQGDRAGLIDQIPAEFIKEVQVTKGNTPDQSADSLGGTVNLISKSAFDYNNRVTTYRLGFYRNVYRNSFNQFGPTGSTTFLDRFGKDHQFGVTVSASYSKTPNTRDIAQLNAYDANNYINARDREYNDQNTRVRAGVNTKFEYRLDQSLRLALNLEENYYASDNDRIDWDIKTLGKDRVADYSVVSRAAIEAGAVPKNTANQTAGIAPGYTDDYTEMVNPTITNKAEKEVKRSHQYKVGVTMEKTWESSKLTVGASFNPSSYDNNFWGFTAQENAGVPVGMGSYINTKIPIFFQTYGPTIGVGANYDNFTATRFEQPDITREEIGDVKADYLKTFVVGRFKAGFDLRNQHRWLINTYRPIWTYVGADGVAGKNAKTGVDDDNLKQFEFPSSLNYSLFNNQMMMRDTFSRQLVDDSFHNNPTYWLPSGTSVALHGTPSIVSEEVPAYYSQFDFRLGRLEVLTGARYEETKVRAVGTYSDSRTPNQKLITVNRSYHDWFPSLNLRYELALNLLLRGSVTTSTARPSFSNITPNTSISYLTDGSGLGTVSQPNPGLLPLYTHNYDLSAEYYIEPAGVLSVGVFKKNISNFIYNIHETIIDGPNNGFNGNYAGWDLATTGNVGSSEVDGLEANYNQQLRFLPAPFNGLSTYVSYTGIWTQGKFDQGNSALPGFVPRSWNIGGVYSYRRFETRLTYHYKSAYLMSYDPLPENEVVVQSDPTVDVNLKYKFSPLIEVYVDVVNLLGKSPNWSTNVAPRHLNEVARYGTRLTFGVSGRF